MTRDILDVARRLGARLKRVTSTEWSGPCVKCGGRDRFALNVQKQIWNCRTCDVGGDAIKLARHVGGMNFVDALSFVGDARAEMPPRRAQEASWQSPAPDRGDDNRDVAIALWRRRQPISGTLAEAYIRRTRGYTGAIPATLGFLPASGDYPAAMISAFGLPSEPEVGVLEIADQDITAVHLVRLRPDGTKLDKRIIGRGFAGSPIAISACNDLLGMAICEGIEDAFSIYSATNLGVWAAGSAPFMPALADAVPSYIEHVTVIADADPSGQRNAHKLAARLVERGFETSIKTLRRRIEAA